jgi:phosphonate transport system substrate-binding protein
MRAKRVDGLQVGVFTYLLAVEEANAEALAVYVSTFAEPAVYDPLLRPEYYSVISVKKGSGITSLADLKGRSFAFVEPASTSGHLVPKTELMKAGIMPDRDMRTRFAGNHAASLIALWSGIAFRADLPADLKAAIKASLLSTPDDPAFIRAAKRWYVDPSRELGLPDLDAYYDRLREVAKLLDLDLKGLQ